MGIFVARVTAPFLSPSLSLPLSVDRRLNVFMNYAMHLFQSWRFVKLTPRPFSALIVLDYISHCLVSRIWGGGDISNLVSTWDVRCGRGDCMLLSVKICVGLPVAVCLVGRWGCKSSGMLKTCLRCVRRRSGFICRMMVVHFLMSPCAVMGRMFSTSYLTY